MVGIVMLTAQSVCESVLEETKEWGRAWIQGFYFHFEPRGNQWNILRSQGTYT